MKVEDEVEEESQSNEIGPGCQVCNGTRLLLDSSCPLCEEVNHKEESPGTTPVGVETDVADVDGQDSQQQQQLQQQPQQEQRVGGETATILYGVQLEHVPGRSAPTAVAAVGAAGARERLSRSRPPAAHRSRKTKAEEREVEKIKEEEAEVAIKAADGPYSREKKKGKNLRQRCKKYG